MSANLHTTGEHARGRDPSTDWVEDIALGVMFLVAAVIVAGILALLLII